MTPNFFALRSNDIGAVNDSDLGNDQCPKDCVVIPGSSQDCSMLSRLRMEK